MAYPFNDIEKKWQKYWADHKTFRADNPPSLEERGQGGEVKPKYYVLDMFPYPSGAGLHVGHPLGYIASDIVSRYKRLKGFNVLHPMGYDSFGLPAEQYAIQTGQHPEKTTKDNIARYRKQMDKIGFSFDWDREVRTSDPGYYKWTQWIFVKLFNSWYNPKTDKAESLETLIPTLKNFSALSEKEKSDALMEYRLAYLSEAWVNWCPQLGTVLANEEVKDGVSERGGYPVERKLMPQWSLRITAYADRLLKDLDNIDWSESIKESQRNWIGKSEGSSVRFHLSPPPGSESSRAGSPSPQERGESIVSEPMQEYYTTDGQIWNLLVDKAKKMRKNPTQAESALWESLRRNVTGLKVRRQHIIDRFIVDFVFLSKMLVIEADGDIHDLQKEEDEARTRALNSEGFRVIRFRNEEILHDIDNVLAKITIELNKLPSSDPAVRIFKEDAEEYSLTPKISPPSLGERGPGGEVIEVFTTRPDTIYGVTFLTLAPESDLVPQLTTSDNKKAVEEYVHYAKNRSERERQADVKKVTGQFTGAYAIHPFTNEKLPIWIGDYVLAGYGTGAVMGVPAHDTRDFAFAKQFNLPIKQVVQPPAGSPPSGEQEGAVCFDAKEGKCINSDLINGLEVKDALKKIIGEIEKRGLGKGKTQFRLRDAIFGRQRYWGEPIPIYYVDGIPKVIEEKHLPLELPQVDKYLPTEDGEPPLARAKNWFYRPDVGVSSPSLGERGPGGEVGGVLETTTMPGWAGSSWYYLRYMDANNPKEFASKETLNYWKDVDLYIGGSEHATGHLLYVRFWTKFLNDLGLIPIIEPAKKLINQGMIQGVSEKIFFLKRKQNFVDLDIDKKNPRIMFKSEREVGIYFSNDPDTRRLSINIKSDFASRKVPIEFVKENVLDISKFIEWQPEAKDDVFICASGYFQSGTFYSFQGLERVDNNIFKTSPEVEKMSKSKFNVVTPDDICTNYGSDTLRLYEMFLGPLEQSKPWNMAGITGVAGFLNRFWRLFHEETKVSNIELKETFKISEEEPNKAELKVLHKTIKKIQWDIENYSFNTSVSAFMIATNELADLKCNKRAILEQMVILLSPYAPHIAEELWEKLGHKKSITFAEFPAYNESYTQDDSFAYPVSFNGKMRFNLELSLSLTPEQIEKEVLAFDQTKKFLEGKQPKKVIVVPKRIVNIVM